MKTKFFTFMTSAVIALFAVSCDKEKPEMPDPELSLQENIEVPAEGGLFSITYSIKNGDGSSTVEASSESYEWIHTFDCSVPEKISFTVDEYTDENQPEKPSSM